MTDATVASGTAGTAGPTKSPPLPEPWLRGAVPGVPPLLMPAVHALMQAMEDVARAAAPLTPAQLWTTPGGAASVGFHLRHLAGSTDRLLTYARGESLNAGQLAVLAAEREPGTPPADAATLVPAAGHALEGAIDVIRRASPESLLEPRAVGRARLPTTVIGLLFHIAEHAQRHAGQVVTTARVVRGLELA